MAVVPRQETPHVPGLYDAEKQEFVEHVRRHYRSDIGFLFFVYFPKHKLFRQKFQAKFFSTSKREFFKVKFFSSKQKVKVKSDKRRGKCRGEVRVACKLC